MRRRAEGVALKTADVRTARRSPDTSAELKNTTEVEGVTIAQGVTVKSGVLLGVSA